MPRRKSSRRTTLAEYIGRKQKEAQGKPELLNKLTRFSETTAAIRRPSRPSRSPKQDLDRLAIMALMAGAKLPRDTEIDAFRELDESTPFGRELLSKIGAPLPRTDDEWYALGIDTGRSCRPRFRVLTNAAPLKRQRELDGGDRPRRFRVLTNAAPLKHVGRCCSSGASTSRGRG